MYSCGHLESRIGADGPEVAAAAGNSDITALRRPPGAQPGPASCAGGEIRAVCIFGFLGCLHPTFYDHVKRGVGMACDLAAQVTAALI